MIFHILSGQIPIFFYLSSKSTKKNVFKNHNFTDIIKNQFFNKKVE